MRKMLAWTLIVSLLCLPVVCLATPSIVQCNPFDTDIQYFPPGGFTCSGWLQITPGNAAPSLAATLYSITFTPTQLGTTQVYDPWSNNSPGGFVPIAGIPITVRIAADASGANVGTFTQKVPDPCPVGTGLPAGPCKTSGTMTVKEVITGPAGVAVTDWTPDRNNNFSWQPMQLQVSEDPAPAPSWVAKAHFPVGGSPCNCK